MTIIKLHLIDGESELYVASEHIVCVGTAFTLASSAIAGVKGKGRAVGTLVSLVNGHSHGVTEKPEIVVKKMKGEMS